MAAILFLLLLLPPSAAEGGVEDSRLSVVARTAVAKNVTISNVAPRFDDKGELLQAQDGCLSNFDGIWYLTAMKYQCCDVSLQPTCYVNCGWYNSTIALYSSPDLEKWHLESDNILPVATNASSPYFNQHTAYFEPCVIFSPQARHFALWFLVIQPMCIVTPPCPQLNAKAVAVASAPVGPFEVVSWDVGLPIGSDLYLWTDATDPANPTTYLKHNGPPPPGETRASHYVTQLSADLLSVVPGATSQAMMIPALPIPPFFEGDWPTCSEGGGIFSAGGRWFVMGGSCCCFCAQGGNAYVWAADSPLGPYTLLDDVGIVAWNATWGKYVTGAQQFSVAPLLTTSGILPMFIGQRFGSADDGLKCHDYQFWAPIHVVDGTPAQIPWVDEWTVELIVNGPEQD